jgi:hypothetical protein
MAYDDNIPFRITELGELWNVDILDMAPCSPYVNRLSETSADMQTTRRYIPADGSIHNCRCENDKCHVES